MFDSIQDYPKAVQNIAVCLIRNYCASMIRNMSVTLIQNIFEYYKSSTWKLSKCFQICSKINSTVHVAQFMLRQLWYCVFLRLNSYIISYNPIIRMHLKYVYWDSYASIGWHHAANRDLVFEFSAESLMKGVVILPYITLLMILVMHLDIYTSNQILHYHCCPCQFLHQRTLYISDWLRTNIKFIIEYAFLFIELSVCGRIEYF